MITRRNVVVAAAAVAVAVLAGTATVTGASASVPDKLAGLRAATDKFHSIATAEQHGYGLFTDAAGIACIAMPGMGAMGVHWVNGRRWSATRQSPEPTGGSRVRPRRGRNAATGGRRVRRGQGRVGCDAQVPAQAVRAHVPISPTTPNRYNLPPFYSLHVWVWKHNSAGTFQMWNPAVHCPSSPRTRGGPPSEVLAGLPVPHPRGGPRGRGPYRPGPARTHCVPYAAAPADATEAPDRLRETRCFTTYSAHSGRHHRRASTRERELEREPDEVPAGCRPHHSPALQRPAVVAGDRRIDPGEVLPEAGAPARRWSRPASGRRPAPAGRPSPRRCGRASCRTPTRARSAFFTRISGPPCARTSGRILRPTGVRKVARAGPGSTARGRRPWRAWSRGGTEPARGWVR